jgi:leucyl-tRNA synthetase
MTNNFSFLLRFVRNREVSTTDPAYVKWTQWIFLQLFKEGLASQTDLNVNWCPALGTVLANEEVIDGLSERGDHPVEKLPLRQWALHIPQYAEELEKDLEALDWPEGTLAAQKQWIGRSEGALIDFLVCGENSSTIEVFTTRADTLYGVTYLVLAPEHKLVESFRVNQLSQNPQRALEIEEYVQVSIATTDIDRLSQSNEKLKTGVFTGEYASHPLTGEKIPIWIADYVLGSYGTGAVMSVPAHDTRDYEFATVFSLPIRRVVKASLNDDEYSIGDLPFLEEGFACNCPVPEGGTEVSLDGMTSADCAQEIIRRVQERGSKGTVTVYKLRDWGFSRQRYWGEPIPIFFPVDLADSSSEEGSIIRNPVGEGDVSSDTDPRYGAPHVIRYDQPIPVREEDLPLTLPAMENFSPGNDPQGCLARAVEWRYFQSDGQWFARETNTMPQVSQ